MCHLVCWAALLSLGAEGCLGVGGLVYGLFGLQQGLKRGCGGGRTCQEWSLAFGPSRDQPPAAGGSHFCLAMGWAIPAGWPHGSLVLMTKAAFARTH